MARPEDRRRASRDTAGWHGDYLLVARPALGWHYCYMIDVSAHGAGLQLRGPRPELGEEIRVRLASIASHVATGDGQIRGTVRNVTADRLGSIRIGLEFGALDPDQRGVLISLLDRQRV